MILFQPSLLWTSNNNILSHDIRINSTCLFVCFVVVVFLSLGKLLFKEVTRAISNSKALQTWLETLGYLHKFHRVRTALSNQNSRTIIIFSRTENYRGLRLSHINPYFPVIQSTHNSSRNSDMLHRNCTRQATLHNLRVQKQGSTKVKLFNEVPICTSCFSLTLSY